MSATIESLELEIQSNATSAVGGTEALASSLEKLRNATKGGAGLTTVSKQITTLGSALNGIGAANIERLNRLTQGLNGLSSVSRVKLSSSIGNQITNIGGAIQSLNGIDFGALSSLASALTPLSQLGKSNLGSFVAQLQRLPQAMEALSSVNFGTLGSQIAQLVQALAPLSQMGRNNLTSFLTQLSKLPQVMLMLKSVDMSSLASQIRQLANAFAPLGAQMQTISAGISSLPNKMSQLTKTTGNLAIANDKASTSYVNFAAKIAVAMTAVRRMAQVIGSWITKSNQYVENLNYPFEISPPSERCCWVLLKPRKPLKIRQFIHAKAL